MGERGQQLGLMLHMLMWWSLSFLSRICSIRCHYSHSGEIGIVLAIVHKILELVYIFIAILLLSLNISILLNSLDH